MSLFDYPGQFVYIAVQKGNKVQKFVMDNLEELGEKSLEYLQGPNIAVSGGSTYSKLFEFWAERLSPENHNFFPVDERLVPYEDEGCNWKMTSEKLFQPLKIEQQKNHWATSESQFFDLLHNKIGDPIIFDQIFLGMGDDGHTASLFPGGEYLLDKTSQVLETTSPKAPFPRVTLGFQPIWNAKELILVVTGENKKEMVKRLFEGDTSLPITLALNGHKNPVVIMDKAAAG